MKKTKFFLILCSIVLVLCSCGKKEAAGQDAEMNTQASESVVSETEKLKTVVSALDGTGWSGTDAEGNAYLVTLNKNQLSYSVHNAAGENTYEGEYSLDATGKLLLENAELVKALKNADIELLLDGADTYLRIGEIYLTADLLKDYEERLRNLDFAALAAEYMNAGHCWVACLEDKVVLLYFDGQLVQMRYMTKDGDKINSETVDANWSLKKGAFAFYDFAGKKIEDFDWNFEEEGDLKTFTIKDEQDGEMTFYELEKDSIQAGEELAESYLENRQNVEGVEDLSNVLNGYEGVSIVDAFVAAGLNPEFDNRAIFAEKFKIENYRGTAEQNLFLLESMGGVIK